MGKGRLGMGGKGEAYGVDVQNVDIRRRHEEILHKRRDHMPGLELAIAVINS